MESRGSTRKNLEPYIGTRARVAEIINRTRPLSLGMIQRLHLELGIPAEALIQPYTVSEGRLRKDAGKGKNVTHASMRAGAG